MSKQVSPIEIVTRKEHALKIAGLLQAEGTLHIEDISELDFAEVSSFVPDEDTEQEEEVTRSILGKADSLIRLLKIEGHQKVGEQRAADMTDIRERLDELQDRVSGLIAERERLQDRLEILPRYEDTLQKLVPLLPAAAHRAGRMVVGLFIDRRHRAILDELRRRITDESGGMADFATGEVADGLLAMLIVIPHEISGMLDGLLGKEEITRLRLPEEIQSGPPDVALRLIEKHKVEIQVHLQEIEDQLTQLSDDWSENLNLWRQLLQSRLDRYNVLDQFGQTDRTLMVIGWVPAEELDRLSQALEEGLEGEVHIEVLPLDSDLESRAPVIMENPRLARPFEGLVRVLDRPKYGHLDPSFLMAIFLPLFFGMMLGDAGYGAVLLLICLLMLRRYETGFVHDLLRIITMGAGWSIVFGFLYGELFGTLGEHLGLHPLWFHRGEPETVPTLLLITVGLGAAHIVLGLLLGLWEAVRDRSRSHLLERGGMLVGLIGIFLLVAVLVGMLPSQLMTPSIAVAIVGIATLGSSAGWMGLVVGPIEFLGVIGNILSYLRIAAIGLASVFLATVANQLVGAVGSLIVGVIVAALIHALNLVMGTFSPAIHSLRLHYVEFFRKFYEGGGRQYLPFGGEKTAGLIHPG